jgi:N-acetylmuramoyl-L-alanine amidase
VLALTSTPGLHIGQDYLILTAQELMLPEGKLSYTTTRLANPARLVLEFPNAKVNPLHKGKTYPINRFGLKSLTIADEQHRLYETVRLVLTADDYNVLDQLHLEQQGATIVILPPESSLTATASPKPPAPVRDNLTLTGVVAPTQSPKAPKKTPWWFRSSVSKPAETLATVTTTSVMKAAVSPPVAEATVSAPAPAGGSAITLPTSPVPSMMATTAVAPSPTPAPATSSSLTLITHATVEQGVLCLQGPSLSQLRVKQRFSLANPSRLVVDLDNAQLANKGLNQSWTSSQTPYASGWRLSQFDDSTVRLVVETNQPNSFALTQQNLGQGLDSLVLAPSQQAQQLAQQQAGQLQATQLKHVLISNQLQGNRAQIKLEAEQPMGFQLAQQGQHLQLRLLNVGLPNNQPMAFNVAGFSYLDALKHEAPVAGMTGSALTLSLKHGAASGVQYTTENEGRTLLISFNVPMAVAGTLASQPSLPASTQKAPYAAKVVVDAGHGGKDHGAIRDGVKEKDLNLAVATYLADALRAKGMQVVMTRTGDSFVPLPEISGFANRNNPDLFVSVHHNASTNTAIAGLETYYYHARSIPLAKKVHGQVASQLDAPDRGVRQAKFYVINHTTAPAILVEVGYVSNPSELQRLQQTERQKKVAEAIAVGVVQYLNARTTAQAQPR